MCHGVMNVRGARRKRFALLRLVARFTDRYARRVRLSVADECRRRVASCPQFGNVRARRAHNSRQHVTDVSSMIRFFVNKLAVDRVGDGVDVGLF
jgi:hypothetical protein